MATWSLRIKNHKLKDNFQGRLVLNQIGDATYKLCKILTQILNPLDEKADSFLQNSKQVKYELENLQSDENCTIGSLDINEMYPMIPVPKTLEITLDQLIQDDTLTNTT